MQMQNQDLWRRQAVRACSAALTIGLLMGVTVCAVAKPAYQPEAKIHRCRIEGQAAATAVFKRTAKKQTSPIVTCYKKALSKTNGLVGELPLSVTIQANGRVRNVRLNRQSTVSNTLFTCVSKVVKGWKLSPWSLKHAVVGNLTYHFQLLASPPTGTVVKGGLQPNQVAGVFAARKHELESCFGSRPTKTLKLVASLSVAFDGRVTRASVSGRGPRYRTKKCMGKKILKWRFPPGNMGHRTWGQVPIMFRPQPARRVPSTTHTRTRVGRGPAETTPHRRATRRHRAAGVRRNKKKYVVPMHSVRIQSVRASGVLAAKKVRRALQTDWAPKTQQCLNPKIKPGEKVTGTLSMRFVIVAKTGNTNRINVSFKATKGSARLRRAVTRCAMKNLKALVFVHPRSRRRGRTKVSATAKVAIQKSRSR
jgi:hypothetical protein